jgi:hypothetical protein
MKPLPEMIMTMIVSYRASSPDVCRIAQDVCKLTQDVCEFRYAAAKDADNGRAAIRELKELVKQAHQNGHNSLHFVSFRFVLFHFASFCFISLRFVSFRFVLFHFASFCVISLRFVSFRFILFSFGVIWLRSVAFCFICF